MGITNTHFRNEYYVKKLKIKKKKQGRDTYSQDACHILHMRNTVLVFLQNFCFLKRDNPSSKNVIPLLQMRISDTPSSNAYYI